MKKLKLNISGFDLGVLIAAVVIAVLGAGAWWYLSGALQDAQTDVTSAKADFDKYSSNPKYHVVVSPSNAKTLQTNIDLIKAQLIPLIQTRLQPKENKLSTIDKEDPVAWKHDLDDDVHRLNESARAHSVTVPANFYFGFSRYLSQSPSDEQTAVLTKQLVGIEQLSTILINEQVKDIQAIRRTYEEDPHSVTTSNGPNLAEEGDQLSGYSTIAPGNSYTTYPLEVDFETTSESFRTVVDNLIQSPYIFVIRSLSVLNSKGATPTISELDTMAGTPAAPNPAAAPGDATTAASTRGPQYLFGNSVLKVKARIDMIEWTAPSITDSAGGTALDGQPKKSLTSGGL
jgi:hypothetical protein